MSKKRPPSPIRALYDRMYYERNHDAIVANRTQRRHEVTEWYFALKATLSCLRCGENDAVCLDFHHRDPKEKSEALGRAIWYNGWSKARILQEIGKCVVLCANCHRKLHAGRFSLDEPAHIASTGPAPALADVEEPSDISVD